MPNQNMLPVIRDSLALLKGPVRVVHFTSGGDCPGCPEAVETAKAIKAASSRIAMAIYDVVMDRDQSQLYGVTRVPSFVVETLDGHGIVFSGLPKGLELVLLLDTIAAVSRNEEWHPAAVLTLLRRLERDVRVQLFLDSECSICRPVGITAIGCSLASRRVHTEVISAGAFPELVNKLHVTMLPTAVLGGQLRAEGHIDEGTFLRMLFQAEGQSAPGAERPCVVCGQPAGDIICDECKTRIQVEAVDHKRTAERLHQRGTVVKPRRNV